MKKLLFGLIATAILSTANSYGQNELNIGQIHNTALDIYYKKYGNEKITNISDLNKKLFHINKDLNPNIFKEYSEKDIEKLTLDVFGTADINNFNFRDDNKALLKKMVLNKLLSENLSNLMTSFIDNNPVKEELLNQIDDFLKKSDSNSKDKKILEEFKSLFLYSNEFWTSIGDKDNTATINNRRNCNAGDQRSFADAFGGMIGGVIGSSFPVFGTAVGAFIGSQGMSAIIRSIQNHHGGGCI